MGSKPPRKTALGLVLLAVEGIAGAAVYFGGLEVLRPNTTAALLRMLRTAASRRANPEGATGHV